MDFGMHGREFVAGRRGGSFACDDHEVIRSAPSRLSVRLSMELMEFRVAAFAQCGRPENPNTDREPHSSLDKKGADERTPRRCGRLDREPERPGSTDRPQPAEPAGRSIEAALEPRTADDGIAAVAAFRLAEQDDLKRSLSLRGDDLGLPSWAIHPPSEVSTAGRFRRTQGYGPAESGCDQTER